MSPLPSPTLFGLAGWSGSGKTQLIVNLVPKLMGRGISVSTVKHAHHDFDTDKPGKDSYAHRSAGAKEVMVSSVNRWALIHENRGDAEPTLSELVGFMSPVDLLLIEGFKWEPHPRLEVHRPALGKPLIAGEDPMVVAVASDAPLLGLDIPVLDLNDVSSIADFVIEHCGLGTTDRKRA